MKTLQERAEVREQLVKTAKDVTVDRIAKLYISQYRTDLEHLDDGHQVAPYVPVGKDKFLKWVKDVIEQFYPEAKILIGNPELLRNFALQVADRVAKSNTDIVNPMKDYKVSKDPVFVKAGKEVYVKVGQATQPFVPSGSIKTPNLHTAPQEHSRYCPDHPGAMMRRVKDNLYQCPINGDLNTVEPWKEKFDYRGGHEVKFDTGVQNQTSEGPNNMHPLLPFLHPEASWNETLKSKGKPYDFEKLYGVTSEPVERQESKNASELLSKLTRFAGEDKIPGGLADDKKPEDFDQEQLKKGVKSELEHTSDPQIAEEIAMDHLTEDPKYYTKLEKMEEKKASAKTCPACGMENCPCMKEGKECKCKKASTKTAQQLFAPTTVMTRQCPDHPGQQLTRVSDNVRQCALDSKVYDFVRGFTTEDGKHHNGGTVQAQGAIPPGSILIKKEAKRMEVVADTPSTHEFLYSILQHLPATAERERKILNYKFQKGVTLEQAIQAVRQAEELAAQPKPQEQQGQATAGLKSFVKKASEPDKPKKVTEIADAIRRDNPGTSDEKAYRMAWETYCSYTNPSYEGCSSKGKSKRKSPKSEY